jgi:hypothetical protein
LNTERLSKPKLRLRNANIGQRVTLVSHEHKQPFVVESIREDGYYELSHNGKPYSIASPGHEVKEIK